MIIVRNVQTLQKIFFLFLFLTENLNKENRNYLVKQLKKRKKNAEINDPLLVINGTKLGWPTDKIQILFIPKWHWLNVRFSFKDLFLILLSFFLLVIWHLLLLILFWLDIYDLVVEELHQVQIPPVPFSLLPPLEIFRLIKLLWTLLLISPTKETGGNTPKETLTSEGHF